MSKKVATRIESLLRRRLHGNKMPTMLLLTSRLEMGLAMRTTTLVQTIGLSCAIQEWVARGHQYVEADVLGPLDMLNLDA